MVLHKPGAQTLVQFLNLLLEINLDSLLYNIWSSQQQKDLKLFSHAEIFYNDEVLSALQPNPQLNSRI